MLDPARSGLVALARVRRAWGRRGELLLELHTDWPHERFSAGRTVSIVSEFGWVVERKVRSYRELTGRALLALEGVDDIGAAENLAGAWILAEAGRLERLAGDAPVQADLLGLRVVTGEGEIVGRVVGVEATPGGDLLQVERTEGGELLIPFSGSLCQVDADTGLVRLTPPEGLLDERLAEEIPPSPRRPRRRGNSR